jgi:HPr kinase/phosphorylase
MASLRLKDILQGREDELGLGQMTGEAGLARSTSSIRIQRYEEAEGFWHRIIPDVILVITPQYVSELTTTPSESRRKIFQAIISNRIPLIAVSETDAVSDFMASFSELYRIPVFTSVYDGFLLESRLSGLLREKLENSISRHGTLVSVSGLGVMFVGDSGTGKTECSLKLAERGHRWIADDAVEIERRGDLLYGRSHELTKGLINIKHRGLVEAKELLDAHAILDDSVINLVVEFGSEHIPRGLPRGKRANAELLFLKNRRFSAACCGELQLKTMDHNGRQEGLCRAEKSLDIMGVRLPCMGLPGFPQTRRIYRHVEFGVKKLMREREKGDS